MGIQISLVSTIIHTATVAWCDENQEETFGHDQQKTRMEEGVYLGAANPNLTSY